MLYECKEDLPKFNTSKMRLLGEEMARGEREVSKQRVRILLAYGENAACL
jgi:hypothetical protein